MTPYDLYYDYRNLYVMLDDFRAVYGIDIHEYRNASLGGDFSVSEGEKAFKELQKKIGEYGQPAGYKKYLMSYPLISKKEFSKMPYVPAWQEYVVTYPDLYEVYMGKGSVDQIKQALRLAVAFGLVKDNKTDLQRYCDKYIGLDCSGFAKSYFNGNVKTIESFAAQNKLYDLQNVRTGTAIVWTNFKHIALVDKVTKVERTGQTIYAVECMVAESTGDQMLAEGPKDGLNYTEYTILYKNPGNVFEVFRSYNNKNGYYKTNVYLVNR